MFSALIIQNKSYPSTHCNQHSIWCHTEETSSYFPHTTMLNKVLTMSLFGYLVSFLLSDLYIPSDTSDAEELEERELTLN